MQQKYLHILILSLSLLVTNLYAQTPLSPNEQEETENFARQFLAEHASSFSKAEYMRLNVVHLDEHIVVLGSQSARCGIVLVRNHVPTHSTNRVLAYSTESIIRPSTNCMQKLLQYYEKVAQTMNNDDIEHTISTEKTESLEHSSTVTSPHISCLLEKNGAALIHQFNYEDRVKGLTVNHTAGCGIVQIMQLMCYWDYPQNIVRYNCKEKHQDKLNQILPENIAIPSTTKRGSDNGHNREDLKLQARIIGVATDSKYHNGWTETTNLGTMHALTAHLGFSRRLELHYQQTIAKMYRNITEDIEHDRPCLITGGEHGFVCDGIDGEFLHFNFGWGGHANGWYRFPTTNEKLGTGFIRSYITGIEPK